MATTIVFSRSPDTSSRKTHVTHIHVCEWVCLCGDLWRKSKPFDEKNGKRQKDVTRRRGARKSKLDGDRIKTYRHFVVLTRGTPKRKPPATAVCTPSYLRAYYCLGAHDLFRNPTPSFEGNFVSLARQVWEETYGTQLFQHGSRTRRPATLSDILRRRLFRSSHRAPLHTSNTRRYYTLSVWHAWRSDESIELHGLFIVGMGSYSEAPISACHTRTNRVWRHRFP